MNLDDTLVTLVLCALFYRAGYRDRAEKDQWKSDFITMLGAWFEDIRMGSKVTGAMFLTGKSIETEYRGVPMRLTVQAIPEKEDA